MSLSRRKFLGWLAALSAGTAVGKPVLAASNKHFTGYPESFGVLFDAVHCIGCRSCEAACNEVNRLPAPDTPFTDLSAFSQDAVQPLSRTGLRVRLFCEGLFQDQRGRGHIQSVRMRGLPVLHDSLPL